MKSIFENFSKEQLIAELDILSSKVESLKESELNYRFLADNVEDVIWRYDFKLDRFLYISPSIFKLRGFTVEEAMNEKLAQAVTPESFLLIKNTLSERLKAFYGGNKTTKKRIDEIQQPCKNGNIIWVEIITTLITNKNNEVVEILGVSRDITKRKIIEADLDNYKTIIDSAFEQTSVPMMLVTTPDNILRIVNTASREYYGIADETDFIGKSFFEFKKTWREYDNDGNVLDDDSLPLLFALKGIPTKNKEIFTVRKDGIKKCSLVTSGPIYNKKGELIAAFVVFPEITRIKEIEDKLRANADEFKSLNDSKDRFFSILAHDLRSPFQALLGISELLSSNIESLTPEEITKFGNELHKAIRNQYDFLTHILEWARIQTRKIEFNPGKVNLYKLISKVFKLLEHSAANKQTELISEVQEIYYVKADENMLLSIMQNLISNAIKFINSNGVIKVTGNQINDNFEISITDNGAGIDEDSLSKLFHFETMFTTKGTAGEKGSGLGLLICKEMIEKHGGKIWVQSKLNEGTKFTFSLPVYKG